MSECDLGGDGDDSRTLVCVLQSVDYDVTGGERDVDRGKRNVWNAMRHIGDRAKVGGQNAPTV